VRPARLCCEQQLRQGTALLDSITLRAPKEVQVSSNPRDRYCARFIAVLDFIDAHLEEELPMEQLSAVAAFSKFHFHRQFNHLFGLSVYRYVQLSRLKRASYQLAFRDEPVMDVALANGYESPESFARAFRKYVLQSPSEFRAAPDWISWANTFDEIKCLRNQYMNTTLKPDEIQTVHFAETKVALLEHRGDPRQLTETIRRFIEWRKQHRLHPSVSATFNILYDDPATTAPEDFRFALCAATDMTIEENDYGVVASTIPAGRCAKLRVKGTKDILEATVRQMYSQWLPESGEEPRDFPLFLQRVQFYPDVPEHEAVTDVFLPIK
jgi:AraC family transcriptional regulator